jgi:dolichol-phosphate mannosyltransferase
MIYILLPCFNEYQNLDIIIDKINSLSLQKKITFKIIIINDGSSDETHEKINELNRKSKNKIIYVHHKKNLGLNMAMFSGFKKFLVSANVTDIAITLDSDNSHPISLIPKIIKPIKENKFDIVIASRFQKGSNIKGLSVFRKVLSEGARFIYKLSFPIKNVEDYTCNFRGYNFDILKNSKLINKDFFLNKDFSVIADFLINLNKENSKLRISEVPLKLRYDFKLGVSKLNISKNIFKTLLVIIRNLF